MGAETISSTGLAEKLESDVGYSASEWQNKQT